MLLVERLLDGMQLTTLRETLDGGDLRALGLDGEHRAGLDGHPVDEHGAGAAARGVAADVCPRETELLPQEVHEQEARLDGRLACLPVDRHLEPVEAGRGGGRFELGHDRPSSPAWAAEIAVRSPRSQKTRTTFLL